MQNQENIIQAIAAKLNEYDTLVSLYDVEEMAQSIAAAIAPHLEAGARCYPEIIQAIKTSPQTKEKYESGENYLIQGGKKYTMKELVDEMENNTAVGVGLQESLFKLTIDLLMRGKEVLK